jgi:Methyltransferase domain
MANQVSDKLSPSVAKDLRLSRKLNESVQLLGAYRRTAHSGYSFDPLFDDIAEYDALLREHADIALRDARIFEIGFGARPYRQLILHSMGVQASGVDAEVPVMSGRPREFVTMVKRNGGERAVKSLVRHALFDRGERRALSSAIRQRGLVPRLDSSKLIVMDAGKLALAPSSLDLVFSEDVFEHIERVNLHGLVSHMAEWLRPHGLALVRPNIFTGIVGGHLLEWSRASLRDPHARRRSEPWEHLRQRRFPPNTYLNEMTRADYRELFSDSFEILEERVAQPDLGRDYLDERAQRDLSNWCEDELFSNQTLFVLRRRI